MAESNNSQNVIDPLLSEQVSVKQYSDNVFSTESSFTEEKTETVAENATTETTETKEKTNIGKDYDGDGVKSMFDQVNDEAKQKIEAEKTAQDDVVNEDQRDVKVTKEQAKSFANMIGYGVDMLLPKLFIYGSKLISRVKEAEIYYHTNVTHAIPTEFYDNYKKDEIDLHNRLKLTEEELTMIKTAFADYAAYAQIKAANPATAFWGTVAMVFVAKTEIALSESAKQNARWEKLYAHYNIK